MDMVLTKSLPFKHLAFFLPFSLFLCTALRGELIISEFLADNSGRTLTDEEGFPADWIEIHNTGTNNESLQNYALTDDADDPLKWIFPPVNLAPGAFLTLFATGENRRTNPNALHTNFSLNADGEYLGLIRVGTNEVVDEFAPQYPPQLTDVSFGLGNGGPIVSQNIIPAATPVSFLVPSSNIGNSWQSPSFDDSSWTRATSALGYGYQGSVGSLIGQNGDVQNEMLGINASIYIRVPFQVTDPAGVRSLTLRTKVDDGFVAFLNGRRIAASNAPTPLTFQSAATSSEEVDAGEDFESRTLNFNGALVPGENILAFQGMNRSPNSNDFILISELDGEIQDLTKTGFRGFFAIPTPRSANGAPSLAPPPAVDFSLTSQAFTRSLQVSLNSPEPAAVIRFTTDGSLPNGSSPIYSDPITLTRTTLIRSRAFSPGSLPGPCRSEGFMRIADGDANFTSDLPIVVISSLRQGIPPASGSTDRLGSFMLIFEPDPVTGRSSFNSPPSLSTRIGSRRRGSSSASFPKYSLSFESWDENDEDLDIAPFNFAPDGDWILNARYLFDLSLMRNPFLYDLSKQIGRWAVGTQFVELFNDTTGDTIGGNDYFGVYTFMERIEGSNGRLDLSGLDPWENSPEEITGGYIFANDRPNPGLPPFAVSGFTRRLVHNEPDGRVITGPQRNFIRSFSNEATVALRTANGINPITGLHFSDYLDVDSFIDNFWLNILSMDPDWGRLSQFFHKDRDERIKAGPIWDYDRTMGSRDNRDNNPERWEAPTNDTSFTWFDTEFEWFGLLFGFTSANDQVMNLVNPQLITRRPDVFQRVIDRWFELRAGAFSQANLEATIESMAAQLAEAQGRNFNRWSALRPGSITGGNFATSGSPGWEREVSHLMGWLDARSTWIDGQFFGPPSFSLDSGQVSLNAPLTIIADRAGGSIFYTIDGSDPRAAGGSPSASAVNSSLAMITQSSTVIARSFNGQQWSAPMAANFVVGADLGTSDSLVISEIMYDPLGPSAIEEAAGFSNDDSFEYIELLNTSDRPVSLAQVQFTEGIDFNFTNSNVTELAPGERVLVVQSLAGFTQRYGNGFVDQIAGEFANNTSLSGSGERLVLSGFEGTISDLTYDNRAPWPRSPDGDGPSLVFISGEQALADNWRPSVRANGSPGTGDAIPFTGDFAADNDNDGLSAFVEYALGTDDNVSNREVIEGDIDSRGRYTLNYSRNLAADDAEVILQVSTDLRNWTLPNDSLEAQSEIHNGDGTATFRLRTPEPVDGTSRLFARLLVVRR